MNAKLFEAIETLKNHIELNRREGRGATNTSTVFEIYRSVHILFPYVKEMTHPDEIKRNILIYGGAFSHYLEFLDEITESVNNQKPPKIASLIRRDLTITSVRDFITIKEKAVSASAGVQSFDYERTEVRNSMGRGGQSVDRYYDGGSLHNTEQGKFIADWTNVPNHIDDMVNFVLATLAYHRMFGSVIFNKGDRRYMVD